MVYLVLTLRKDNFVYRNKTFGNRISFKGGYRFILGRRGRIHIYDTSCMHMHVIGWKFEESGTWWVARAGWGHAHR
jgi:hypothetical protein